MTSRDRLVYVAAALAAMLAMFGWPMRPVLADNSGTARLSVIAQHGDTITLRLAVDGLPIGATVDPASAQVTFDGRPVPGVRATADGAVGGSPRQAMLVVDTSGSMSGAGVIGARQAADAYLSAVPPDVRVGLITFSDRPRLDVAPSTSRGQVQAAVRRLTASGETSLYDAVALAAHVLGRSGDRSIVVLSDGEDTRSTHDLRALAVVLRRSGARLDAVAFNTGTAVRRHLATLAGVSGGRVTSAADAAGLAASFSSAARTFSSGLTIVLHTPSKSQGYTARVSVTARTATGLVQASTNLAIAGSLPSVSARSVRASGESGSSSGVPMAALLFVFVGLAGLSWMALDIMSARRSPGARTRRLLQTYTYADSRPAQEVADGDSAIGASALARGALRIANRFIANPARRDKVALRLAQAGVGFKPGEWLVVQMFVVVVVGTLGVLLFQSLVGGVVLGILAYVSCTMWLSIKGRRRLRDFDDQLPGTLQVVAGSLRAGFSLSQSLDAVVQEGLQPIAGEIHRALAEVRLGVSVEDALEHIAERMQSLDFRWVVMAIRIQREVGGNLAEVLLTTATTMRDRARLRRQVRALSAEGRLSAYILFALPVVMSLYMLALRRSYIRPLYTQPSGIAMLAFAVLLLFIGAVWMRKVVTVEA